MLRIPELGEWLTSLRMSRETASEHAWEVSISNEISLEHPPVMAGPWAGIVPGLRREVLKSSSRAVCGLTVVRLDFPSLRSYLLLPIHLRCFPFLLFPVMQLLPSRAT
jgi:hypothetical protein